MAKYVIEDTTLTNTANAIREKTGKTDTITPSNFATEIASIEVGGGKFSPKYISFYRFDGDDLQEELNNLDTSNITNMNYMFAYCNNLKTVDLSGLDTSNVTTLSAMFDSCTSLTNVNINGLDFNKVTKASGMFSSCSNLVTLDLSNFYIDNVKDLSEMFYWCPILETVDISGLNRTNKVTTTTNMFHNCYKIKKIIINNNNIFPMSSANTLKSTAAKIFVPDNLVDSYKSATNWSDHADQIKPISELEGNQ